MNTLTLPRRALLFRSFALATSLVAIALSMNSCRNDTSLHPSTSSTTAVDIPQTPVKNQYAIGFCWSYATLALIESNHKLDTGEEIDLSEEALGYMRMRYEMAAVAKKYRAADIPADEVRKWLEDKSLEGWFVRSHGSSPVDDAMELIDRYGLVPESTWSLKFKSRAEVNALKRAMIEPYLAFLNSDEPISNTALDKVMTVDGAFPESPPSKFMFDERYYTPQEFAKNYLKFQSRDYKLLQAKSAADSRTIIQATKKAMAAGFSVPVSFGVSMRNLKNGVFSAKDFEIRELDTNPEVTPEVISLNGNHAVIATDFVNRGGAEGEIAPSALVREISKSADELQYLKLKNSWGANSSTTEDGIDVNSSTDGFYRMDYAYIKAVSAKGRFAVVVPKKFAP